MHSTGITARGRVASTAGGIKNDFKRASGRDHTNYRGGGARSFDELVFLHNRFSEDKNRTPVAVFVMQTNREFIIDGLSLDQQTLLIVFKLTRPFK